MSNSDAYRIVTSKFIRSTDKAIIIEKPPSKGRGTCAVPRSVIHGADDLKIFHLHEGDEFTFRLREWKADELGLA